MDPLNLNTIAQTRGGMPYLLDLLKDEYTRYMDGVNAKRKAENKPTLDAEKTLAAAEPFLRFCRKYLTENRPVQCFPIDMNYGIQLSNSMRCAVSPGVEVPRGTMQDSPAVAISVGQSQPGTVQM